jgi:hypothetical protein
MQNASKQVGVVVVLLVVAKQERQTNARVFFKTFLSSKERENKEKNKHFALAQTANK